mgnify:CR=1 FL=1
MVFDSFTVTEGNEKRVRTVEEMLSMGGHFNKSMVENLTDLLSGLDNNHDTATRIKEALDIKIKSITATNDIVNKDFVNFINKLSSLEAGNEYKMRYANAFTELTKGFANRITKVDTRDAFYEMFDKIALAVSESEHSAGNKVTITNALLKVYLAKVREFESGSKEFTLGKVVQLIAYNIYHREDGSGRKGGGNSFYAKVRIGNPWVISKVNNDGTFDVHLFSRLGKVTDKDIYLVSKDEIIDFKEHMFSISDNDRSPYDENGKRILYAQNENNGLFTEVSPQTLSVIPLDYENKKEKARAKKERDKISSVKSNSNLSNTSKGLIENSRNTLIDLAKEVLATDAENETDSFYITFEKPKRQKLFSDLGITSLQEATSITLEHLRHAFVAFSKDQESRLWKGKPIIMKSAYLDVKPVVNFIHDGLRYKNSLFLEDIHSYYEVHFDENTGIINIKPMHPGILFNEYLDANTDIEKATVLAKFTELYAGSENVTISSDPSVNLTALTTMGVEYNDRAAIYDELYAAYKDSNKSLMFQKKISELESVKKISATGGKLNAVANQKTTMDKALYNKISSNNAAAASKNGDVKFNQGMMFRRGAVIDNFDVAPAGSTVTEAMAYETGLTGITDVQKLERTKLYVGVVNENRVTNWQLSSMSRASKPEFIKTIHEIFTAETVKNLRKLAEIENTDSNEYKTLQKTIQNTFDFYKKSGNVATTKNGKKVDRMNTGFKILSGSVEAEITDNTDKSSTSKALVKSKKVNLQGSLNLRISGGHIVLEHIIEYEGISAPVKVMLPYKMPIADFLPKKNKSTTDSDYDSHFINKFMEVYKRNLWGMGNMNMEDYLKLDAKQKEELKYGVYGSMTGLDNLHIVGKGGVEPKVLYDMLEKFRSKLTNSEGIESFSQANFINGHDYHMPMDSFTKENGFTPEWFIGKAVLPFFTDRPLFKSNQINIVANSKYDENKAKQNRQKFEADSKPKEDSAEDIAAAEDLKDQMNDPVETMVNEIEALNVKLNEATDKNLTKFYNRSQKALDSILNLIPVTIKIDSEDVEITSLDKLNKSDLSNEDKQLHILTIIKKLNQALIARKVGEGDTESYSITLDPNDKSSFNLSVGIKTGVNITDEAEIKKLSDAFLKKFIGNVESMFDKCSI